MGKLTFLWYVNFGEKKGLCRRMAWLPFQTYNKLKFKATATKEMTNPEKDSQVENKFCV